MITPHGGKLINRQLEGNKLERCADEVKELPAITISQDTYEELENIATGAFSPIEGFMNREELTSLLERDRLPDDTVWIIPILMDTDDSKAGELSNGQEIFKFTISWFFHLCCRIFFFIISVFQRTFISHSISASKTVVQD